MHPALTIDPAAIYLEGDVALALDIPLATLARARREHRVRFSRQGKRVLYLGSWLVDWISNDTAHEGRKEAAHV